MQQPPGSILQFETEKILKYDYLSNLSNYEDKPENYSIIEFKLISIENKTELNFSQSNFITEVDYKHSKLYWNVTLEKLKRVIENL
ncbi:MAG: SRPBCC domain-containing protein [Cyanobacteriota bacterium]